MKSLLKILLLSFLTAGMVTAQVSQAEINRIRQQMAKIRQTTDWNNPVAAQKANEEIQKLARQLTGQQPDNAKKNTQSTSNAPTNFAVKTAITSENVLAIANRFYNRSYKALDGPSKFQFDQDLKKAENDKFSMESVRKLTTSGAVLITFGNDHHLACAYLSAAVKAKPEDTLSINNFGGYLRVIDSIETSLPVLLYANKLFNRSPVILTQIGCSYFDLNDYKQAEVYLKEALKYDPGFGQAHTTLCDLYIQQNRLRDAILELFAGVKGMGCSYSQAAGTFSYLEQQSEKSDTKESFWNETRNQIKPEDALAPLVPEDNRLNMPSFPNCQKVADWMEGGGYTSAVQAYKRFHDQLMSFVNEFQQVHKEVSSLPANAILRDYASERFALDCITEYFFNESKKEADNYQKELDAILKKDNMAMTEYMEKHERLVKQYVSCVNGCGTDAYCIEECHRKYCSEECPAANFFNTKHQGYYEDANATFKKTVENQKKILDDLYAFTGQWFSRIQSPYWSKIYAYEIQRVALSIIGNPYSVYPLAFLFPVHNDCGTDCSLFANPYPIPAEPVKKKEPKANECPENNKISLGVAICSLAFDCESIEFGCSAGAALSAKRNFKNKSTTLFIGGGGQLNLIGASAGMKVGATITRSDSGDTDVGGKFEMNAAVGSPGAQAGKSYSMTATVMEGAKSKMTNVMKLGF